MAQRCFGCWKGVSTSVESCPLCGAFVQWNREEAETMTASIAGTLRPPRPPRPPRASIVARAAKRIIHDAKEGLN